MNTLLLLLAVRLVLRQVAFDSLDSLAAIDGVYWRKDSLCANVPSSIHFLSHLSFPHTFFCHWNQMSITYCGGTFGYLPFLSLWHVTCYIPKHFLSFSLCVMLSKQNLNYTFDKTLEANCSDCDGGGPEGICGFIYRPFPKNQRWNIIEKFHFHNSIEKVKLS